MECMHFISQKALWDRIW